MASIQVHLNLQMQKIRNSLPKQLLEEDSSDQEPEEIPDDSLHDPDYIPDGLFLRFWHFVSKICENFEEVIIMIVIPYSGLTIYKYGSQFHSKSI